MAENYVLLETIELTQSASSVTFDNLPSSGYTDLKVVVSARTNSGGGQAAALYVQFNGDTGSNYVFKGLEGYSGTGIQSYGSSPSTYHLIGGISTDASTAGTYGSIEFYIPNYLGNQIKNVIGDGWGEYNSTTLGAGGAYASYWNNTSAVTSMVLSVAGNFAVGSTFSLYGIAAKNTTPVVAPLATGGNIIANDGTYWYHAFLSSGYFEAQTALTCTILQVAGGGGAGGNNGGGGGAGGVNLLSNISVAAGQSVVTVGAGGAGSPGNSPRGYNGSNSQFASQTAAIGGGGGGSYYDRNGGNGGSGGGGGAYADLGSGGTQGIGGSATSGQGNAGGNGQNNSHPNHRGGGGGGAGAAGSAGSGTPNGGAGTSTYSAWGLATGTGQNSAGTVYYAGGGGGAAGGSGGVGGGGSAHVAGTRGTGGGGGANANGNTTPAQPGGSGVVIIKYAMV